MLLRDSINVKVPAARTVDLVTTESKDEVLVYDQTVHHIHHLNSAAAKVWRLCDGERTMGEIAAESGLAADTVKLALRTLEDAQLLDGPLAPDLRGTQTRRTFLRKAAAAGVAVPAIVSITAPSASAAQSGEWGTCSNDNECYGACKNQETGVNVSNGGPNDGPYTCMKKLK